MNAFCFPEKCLMDGMFLEKNSSRIKEEFVIDIGWLRNDERFINLHIYYQKINSIYGSRTIKHLRFFHRSQR